MKTSIKKRYIKKRYTKKTYSKKRIKTRKTNNKKQKNKNVKKKYYGGDDIYDIDESFFEYKEKFYELKDFHYMITKLTNFITKDENYETYFKGSILDLIIDLLPNNYYSVDFSELPHIIQLILKLEIKPSNAIYFINYMLGYEKAYPSPFLTKICKINKIKNLIDTTRGEPRVDSISGIDGWIILSQLLDLVILILKDLDIDREIVDEDEKEMFEGTNIIEIINLIVSENKFIECGFLKYMLNNKNQSQDESDSDETSPFQELYKTIFKETIRKPEVIKDINRIEDFFNIRKNGSGIMPPFILLLLSCRINPAINDFRKNREMDHYRKSIMLFMNKLNFCCKDKDLCCVDICEKTNCRNTETVKPTNTVKQTNTVTGTTCDSVDITPEKAGKVLSVLNLLTKSNINTGMCPSLCRESPIEWNTFDPIFNLFTNVSGIFTERDLVQQFLFDTIIPYSTFFPLNINSYFNEVVYKKQDVNFDKKIDFYEERLLKAYTDGEYQNPICVPNDIMLGITKEWSEAKKDGEKKSFFSFKRRPKNP